MKTRWLWALCWAVVATGTLRLLTKAEVVTMAGTAAEEGLVSVAIEHRNDLNLAATQVDALEAIRAQLRKDSIQVEAALRVAEIELSELQRAEPADMAKIGGKLMQIAPLRAQLSLLPVTASEKAKATLTSEQRSKLKAWSSDVTSPIRQSDLAESDIENRVLASLCLSGCFSKPQHVLLRGCRDGACPTRYGALLKQPDKHKPA